MSGFSNYYLGKKIVWLWPQRAVTSSVPLQDVVSTIPNEPKGPSLKTAVPGPKTLQMIKELGTIQVRLI